ncbi:MAG TPA: lysylphosphatidylglycerol synthase transmembrane domain-containing protein [Anaerolineales bacterium]|nr:lysylphosphatidylglycerol synthase transmembrane domain-containing protein [Anaerolineales bacterium]
MKKWQFWVGMLIGAIFIYWTFNGLDWKGALDAALHANYWWVIPGVLAYMAGVWFRAWRWHYLLKPVKPISTNQMFPIVTIGYMGNNIFPARAGEVLRAWLLKHKHDIPISASLATIVVERIFDGITMLAFVVFNLNELARLQGDSGYLGSIQQVALYGTLAFGGALLIFILAAMFPQVARRIYHPLIEKLLPKNFGIKVLGIADQFMDGLASLRSPLNVLMVLISSLAVWLAETLKYWFVMLGFNFSVSFFALMLMNGVANLATTIPGPPGNAGTFDAPGIAVLVAYGVPKEIATSYTLVLHIALWIVPTLLGAFFFLREGLSWDKVQEMQKEVE